MIALGKDRKKGRVHYYRCSTHYTYHASLAPRECSEKSVRGAVSDDKAWRFVLEVLNSDAHRFEQALRDAQAVEADAKRPKRERLETVLRLITDCESEADNLAEAAKRVRGIVGERLKHDAEQVDQEYRSLTLERDDLITQLGAESLTDDDIAVAIQFREDVKVGKANPTFDDKRWALDLFKVKATVKDGEVTVKCKIPKLARGLVESHIPTSCG